jgi:hypothetical protein
MHTTIIKNYHSGDGHGDGNHEYDLRKGVLNFLAEGYKYPMLNFRLDPTGKHTNMYSVYMGELEDNIIFYMG